MKKSTLVLFASALVLAGCQHTAPLVDATPSIEQAEEAMVATPPQEAPVASTSSAQETATDQAVSAATPVAQPELSAAQQITRQLIALGQQAFAEQRLLTPEDDNANMYFQAALGREPGNFEAIQGIAAIVEQYTQWAWSAARQGNYQTAQRYLHLAQLANPEDPLIVEMTGRINDLKQRRAQQAASQTKSADSTLVVNQAPAVGVYSLPAKLFSLSDEEIIERMQPIIDKVAATQSQIEINWPNDKEARLMYQIINSRVAEFRVRAMIFHRNDHTIELQLD